MKSKFKPLEIILIDLDDTLVVEQASAEAAFLATCEHAAKKYGCDSRALTDAVKTNARKLWYDAPTKKYCLKVGISSWEGLWARFLGGDPNLNYLRSWTPEYRRQSWFNALSEFGIDDLQFAEQLSDTFVSERQDRHLLFPDVEDSLEQLKRQYSLVLITNGAPDLQREKIERTGIGKFFSAVFISGDIGIGKPDIRFFKPILERFSINPSSTVLVGDNLDTDIKGAQNIGVRSIWINRGRDVAGDNKGDNKIVPEYQIQSLTELKRMLL